MADSAETPDFRQLRTLTNHWSGSAGPSAYYWYLTFENCLPLRELAAKCQRAITFSYYDHVPLSDLHVTLDRIGYVGSIAVSTLSEIASVARTACVEMVPLEIVVGPLSGVAGAIGFDVIPREPLEKIRDTLRAATLGICPDAPIENSDFRPHLTIAYSNAARISASDIIARVAEINNSTAPVSITVGEGSLVLLERRQRSYAWQAIARVPLAGP